MRRIAIFLILCMLHLDTRTLQSPLINLGGSMNFHTIHFVAKLAVLIVVVAIVVIEGDTIKKKQKAKIECHPKNLD